jgi:hypothetical protein
MQNSTLHKCLLSETKFFAFSLMKENYPKKSPQQEVIA